MNFWKIFLNQDFDVEIRNFSVGNPELLNTLGLMRFYDHFICGVQCINCPQLVEKSSQLLRYDAIDLYLWHST
jgi:hypothetical protein